MLSIHWIIKSIRTSLRYLVSVCDHHGGCVIWSSVYECFVCVRHTADLSARTRTNINIMIFDIMDYMNLCVSKYMCWMIKIWVGRFRFVCIVVMIYFFVVYEMDMDFFLTQCLSHKRFHIWYGIVDITFFQNIILLYLYMYHIYNYNKSNNDDKYTKKITKTNIYSCHTFYYYYQHRC